MLVASKAQFVFTTPGSSTCAPLGALGPLLTCRPWHDLTERIAEWDALAAEASEPNPFFESWYLLPSLRALSSGDVRLILYEEGGILRGLMPVVSRRQYSRWPLPHLSSWLHPNCFLGVPLVARGSETAFWRHLFDWVDENAGSAMFLHLPGVTLGGPLHAALQAVVAMQTRRAEIVHTEQRAMLESQLSADHYWETSLSAKKRKELRRQASRLAELGELRFDRETGRGRLADWTEEFLALEASGWKGRAGSALASSPATASLLREALAGAADRGRLERLTLTLDGKAIAMLASFVAPPGAFSFKTAYDENFARFSPGVLLQQQNLAILERHDVAWSDSCAAADHPMIDHIWRERRAIGRISVAIGRRWRRNLFGRLVDTELDRQSGGSAQ